MSRNKPSRESQRSGSDQGFVLVAVIATLIPLLLIVGASSSLLTGGLSRVRDAVADSQAFLAAESGIDSAIHRATSGTLTGGGFTADMGRGMTHTVTYFELGTDGIDNDLDTVVDEPDEDVLRVFSVGEYRTSKLTLVAYLGRVQGITDIKGAMLLQGSPVVKLWDNAYITGHNTNLDRTLGDPAFSVEGLSSPPATAADLAAAIDASEAPMIQGIGGSPSLGLGTQDLPALIGSYRQAATNVISGLTHKNVNWGDSATGDWVVSYANHDLIIKGNNSKGAGILICEGQIKIYDGFVFDGLIIATEELQVYNDVEILGGIIVGDTAGQFHMKNDTKITYSKEVIDIVRTLGLGEYVLFNGWQRVANQ